MIEQKPVSDSMNYPRYNDVSIINVYDATLYTNDRDKVRFSMNPNERMEYVLSQVKMLPQSMVVKYGIGIWST